MKPARSAILMLALATAPLLGEDNELGRGVARVSLTNGDVSVRRGDSGDWIAAAVNAPLVTGDRIAAGRASRAELQLDYANFLRLAESTEVRLADLENRRYQLQVARGLVTYRILRDFTSDVEINTPTVAVRPLKRGIYRIEVLESGETEITVRDGKAEVSSSQGTETLDEGRRLVVRTGASDRAVEVREVSAGGRDDWDRWNERRDDYLRKGQSNRYVHNSVYGVEDLDDHGSWRHVGGYGDCWFPRVDIGWSPYHYGRWSWIDWYGWSWIGYEPWGWAPYHYGRWFYRSGFGWGWHPGSVYARSYWSPGLVGFFGWGGHRGFSAGTGFGYGHIGWVPLAPGEAYYPWYGRGRYGRGRNVYIDNSVNITNVTNVRNVYRNAGVNGGVISVDTEQFGRGAGTARRVNVAEVGNAGQIRGLIPVVPDQQSLRVANREGRVARAEGPERRFFTRREPGSVERVPFAEQQQQMARAVRGERTAAPAAQSSERSIRALGEAGADRRGGVQAQPSERPVERQGATEGAGWRRMGEDRRGGSQAGVAAQPSERRIERQEGGGWRRLGEERRGGSEAGGVAAQPSERRIERQEGGGLRRMGEEPRGGSQAGVAAQPSERRVERQEGGGWRRLGEEPRGQPSERTVERNSEGRRSGEERRDGDSAWRRFGQIERNERPRQEGIEGERDGGGPRREMPGMERSGAPRLEQREPTRREPNIDRSTRGAEDRGGRGRLEINRPIMTERAPRGDGGGRAAPAPRGGDGGGRSTERGGGGRGRQ